MNELIMSHNAGIKNVQESMKEVLELYRKVTGSYRPLLGGERYLTDDETSKALKVSRRTLQEYRSNGVIPYILLGREDTLPRAGSGGTASEMLSSGNQGRGTGMTMR